MRNIWGKFERQDEHLISNRQFAARLLGFAVLGVAIEVAVILIGSLGFHYIGGLTWLDGALNATMVITGNGPAFEPHTEGAKIFQIIFSLSGVICFILILSAMLAPILHRVLHHFHITPNDSTPMTKKE
jgi:hypothetical protein